MLIVDRSQVKKGTKVYRTFDMPHQDTASFEAFMLVAEPHINNIGSYFIKAQREPIIYKGKSYEVIGFNKPKQEWLPKNYGYNIGITEFSLCDAGVNHPIPSYNNHHLFDCLPDVVEFFRNGCSVDGINTTTPATASADFLADYARAMKVLG